MVLARELELPDAGGDQERQQDDQDDQRRASHGGEAIGSSRGAPRRRQRPFRPLRIATIMSASRSVFPSDGRRSTSSETAPSYPERVEILQESIDVEHAVSGREM